MTIFITGGHVTPALACIEELIYRNNDVAKPKFQSKRKNIFYLGQRRSILFDRNDSGEYKAINQLGERVKFLSFHPGKLVKEFSVSSFIWLLRIPIGFIQAIYFILLYKPTHILTFGSHVGVPVAIVGKIFGVKVVIHEQTVVLGRSNKVIRWFADVICVSWDSSLKQLSKKTSLRDKVILTGNPVRRALREVLNYNNDNRLENNLFNDKNKPTIFITGGNQGSHVINDVIFANLVNLIQRFNIIHQTGSNTVYDDYSKGLKFSIEYKGSYLVFDYIANSNDWFNIIHSSDLIITRSGANTITELIIFEKPSMTIPIPNSTGNEQELNAKLLESLGLTRLVPQELFCSKDFNITENIYQNLFKHSVHSVTRSDSVNKVRAKLNTLKKRHITAHTKIIDILLGL